MSKKLWRFLIAHTTKFSYLIPWCLPIIPVHFPSHFSISLVALSFRSRVPMAIYDGQSGLVVTIWLCCCCCVPTRSRCCESPHLLPRSCVLFIFPHTKRTYFSSMAGRVRSWWFFFLDAPSHLYKRLCPSVRPSVRPVLFLNDENRCFRGFKFVKWHHEKWYDE